MIFKNKLQRVTTHLSPQIDAHNPSGVTVDNGRLAVIMVGLPARGKTFLCNKLKCYLNWWVPVCVRCCFYTA